MTPDPVEETARRLDEALAEVSAATNRQWSGKAAFKLTIPVDEQRDSDCILTNALVAAKKALTAVRHDTARVAALEEALRKAANVWDWLVSQMMDPHSSAYVDWDAFEDFSMKAGLISETRYDPEKHGPDFESVEPGDPFWILTPAGQRLAKAALAPPGWPEPGEGSSR